MALRILWAAAIILQKRLNLLKKNVERRIPSIIKKHFDGVIKQNTVLSTLSYDKDRTNKGDMFYATYKKLDKHQYNAMFNRKVKQEVLDEDGNAIGTGYFLKYKINNTANKDMMVASEDSGAKKFLDLYSKDRDFYNFVRNPERMQKYFVDDKYKFKGYREARALLDKIRKTDKPSETDVRNVYRMFNYVIPYDGDKRGGRDVSTQRAKFFEALKKDGYSALLDTNDAIYGGFKATSPVIVFDRSAILLKDAERTTVESKKFSSFVTAGRKVLGV